MPRGSLWAAAAAAAAATAAAAALPPPTTAAAVFPPPTVRQDTRPFTNITFDAWDPTLWSLCIRGRPGDCPAGYGCRTICLANGGRCFTNDACIALVPVGGACTPGRLAECVSGSVCVDGACTDRADVLAAIPLGGGCDASTAVCADGLTCEDGGTRRQHVAPIGIAPRVCTRTVGTGEGCDDATGAVRCARGSLCVERPAGAATAADGLRGVCSAPDTVKELNACTTKGSTSECVAVGTVCITGGAPPRCAPVVEEGGYCGSFLPCDAEAPGRLACVRDATARPVAVGGGFGMCRPLERAPKGALATPLPTVSRAA